MEIGNLTISLLLDEEFRVGAVPIAGLFRAVDAGLDEVVLALIEFFLATCLLFIPVAPVYIIAEIAQSEEGERRDPSDPDGETEQVEHEMKFSISHFQFSSNVQISQFFEF